jgi:hypothetical protein
MVTIRATTRRSSRRSVVDAWSLVRMHSEELRDAADSVTNAIADARVAGLIVLPSALHGAALRALLWQCHGDSSDTDTCVGIVESAALAQQFAHDIEHVALAAAIRAMPMHALPVLVATPTALRLGSIAATPRTFAADRRS